MYTKCPEQIPDSSSEVSILRDQRVAAHGDFEVQPFTDKDLFFHHLSSRGMEMYTKGKRPEGLGHVQLILSSNWDPFICVPTASQ